MVFSSIFGADDRVVLSAREADSFPAKLVVRISATWSDGFFAFGSGAIVGRNDVLTAGHVVYSSAHGGLASQIVVQPGYENGSGPLGQFVATDAVPFAPNWITSATADDLAVIHTSALIGDQLGWLAATTTNLPLKTSVTATGYPADIASGNMMVRTSGTIDAKSNGLLFFQDDLDLAGGQSGSALLTTDANGLHTLAGVLLGYQYDSQLQIVNLAREVDTTVRDWLDTATGQHNAWSVDQSQPAYPIARYYLALFDRSPDVDGLNYWVQQAKHQVSLSAIAGNFIASSEFKMLHGDTSQLNTDQFVTLVYQQLLHRTPENGGLEYWKGVMAAGATQSDILSTIALSAEAIGDSMVALAGLHPTVNGDWTL